MATFTLNTPAVENVEDEFGVRFEWYGKHIDVWEVGNCAATCLGRLTPTGPSCKRFHVYSFFGGEQRKTPVKGHDTKDALRRAVGYLKNKQNAYLERWGVAR